MFQRQHQRNRPAERMADDQRPLEPKPLDEPGDGSGLRAKRGRCFAGAGGIATAGPIQNNDAVIVLEPIEQRMREVVHLAAEAVDEHEWRT